MPPKKPDSKKSTISSKSKYLQSDCSSILISPRSVHVSLVLQGEFLGPADIFFLVVYDGVVLFESQWQDELECEIDQLPIDLKLSDIQEKAANTPLIFLLRSPKAISPKGKVEGMSGPLVHPDNRGGGNVDLWPLVLGEQEILVTVPLISIATDTYGENMGLEVRVEVKTTGTMPEKKLIPLMLTMISANCLPLAKDGTAYIASLSLDGIDKAKYNDLPDNSPYDGHPNVVSFDMSLSDASATNTLWATASSAGLIANTQYMVPNDDQFVPEDLDIHEPSCRSTYWNALKRILVNPLQLRERLAAPFYFEMAGVPRAGKMEARGRYMAVVDATALLEPGECGLTTCAKIKYYDEAELPANTKPLLDLPPTSAKIKTTGFASDELNHATYITIRFDLFEPLIPKVKLLDLYETIGFPPPEGQPTNQDTLYIEPPPEDTVVDVRHIRVECGALAVHKELSSLACRGAVPMNQGIKRTAANRLLTRVRTMLKQFSPGDCSYLEWQDTITGQHASARRAVSHSFAPQPPPVRMPAIPAAARCRMAGDYPTAEKHLENSLKFNNKHPRALLAKALRCLEARQDREAKDYILQGLSSQTRNRFLLWIYGAQEFNKGEEVIDSAKAAFRIAVKGDYANGTATAIGWAALHAINHYDYNPNAAFVAAKKMRKSYELIKEWKVYLQRWVDTSGEEEVFWCPAVINPFNPMLIASAFFLCLRCYAFSERLLQCYEEGCGTRGSRLGLVTKITPDVYYLRAASWLLRRQIDEALKITDEGIVRFGPSAVLSQMRTMCLRCLHGWNGECESALVQADRAGAMLNPSLLLAAAMAGMRADPHTALQRAARAHKDAPSAYSALAIGRIYMRLGDSNLAERWAAVAVKYEPNLADGWAFLAVLALRDKYVDKARAMLRTARQVGPISPDIDEQLRRLTDIVKSEIVPDAMMKNLCLCDYLDS